MFDRRGPCTNCPFRIGQGSRFQLSRAPLDEIRAAPAFQCHKSVTYGSDDEEPQPGPRPQQCAGLTATLLAEDRPNQIMQVAMRLDALDPGRLDRTLAYTNWRDVEAAHLHGREPVAEPDDQPKEVSP